jgi:NMD protein affecting ribosome stability and mRNA decay
MDDTISKLIDKHGGFDYYSETEEDVRKRADLITSQLNKKFSKSHDFELIIENAENRPPFAVSWKVTEKYKGKK